MSIWFDSPSDDEKSTDCSSSESMLGISLCSTPACRLEAGSSSTSRTSSSSDSILQFERCLAITSNSHERRMKEIKLFKEQVARHETTLAQQRRKINQEQDLCKQSSRTSNTGPERKNKELKPGKFCPSRAATPSPPTYRRQPFEKRVDRSNLTALSLLWFEGRKFFKNPSDEYLEYFAPRSPAQTVQHRKATTRATQTTDHLEALEPSERTSFQGSYPAPTTNTF